MPLPSITDLTRRHERRPLVKPNAAYYLWRFGANGARAGRALVTPRAFQETRAIARELTQEGIVVAPSDRFLSGAGREALAAASAAIIDASRTEAVREIITGAAALTVGKKSFRIDLVRGAIRAENPLLKVALDPKLLEIVAAYLGMWPALHAIGTWLNYPTNEPATSSQLWHHDPEDLRIIKTFIYLEDVGENNGPFTYVPRTHPFGANVPKAARYDNDRRVQDEQIGAVFPPGTWRVCTGPAGTMIVADTLGFHRGGKPRVGTRLLVTFTYTSGTPLVEHAIRLKGEPTWISSPIQRCAIKQIPIAPMEPGKEKKKKSEM
jgi:hypothetical protein